MFSYDIVIWMQALDFQQGLGGAEVFSLRLANGLMDRGYRPIIFAAHLGWKRPFLEFTKTGEKEIPILRLPSPRIWLLGSFIYIVFVALYLAVYYNHVKVIHINSINRVATLVGFISQGLKKKVVCRSIGGDVQLLRKFQIKKYNVVKLHIWALNKSSWVVSQSNDSTKIMRQLGINRSKIVQIPNGVDIQRYKPYQWNKNLLRSKLGLSEYRKIICCVNRLHPEKRVDIVVVAFSQLLSKCPDIGLLIIGDGRERNNLQQLVDNLGIRKNVRFEGFVDDPLEYLQASDVYARASDIENFSNAMLEAMACELSVVATAVEGHKECIQQGMNGFLVPPSSPTDMALALLDIIKDDYLGTRMGTNARESVVMHYTLDLAVDRYLSLYDFSSRVAEK